MIVADAGDEFRLITQPAHAELSGQLADHWGNERFDRPEPRSSVVVATYHHDNGWREYDMVPRLDPSGEPVNFVEAPHDEWVAFYDTGIENVVSVDRYAGLLVSMHGTGVRRRRYGAQPGMPDRSEAYAAFVEEQEALQRRLADELLDDGDGDAAVAERDVAALEALHATGSYEGTVPRSDLVVDYLLLQLFDRLSLYFCTTEALTETTIGPVPVAADREPVDLSVVPSADREVLVDPYPFDESPCSFVVSGRRIPGGTYSDGAALVDAYFASPRWTLEFTVRSP